MSGTFVDQFIPERDNLVFSIAGILVRGDLHGDLKICSILLDGGHTHLV